MQHLAARVARHIGQPKSVVLRTLQGFGDTLSMRALEVVARQHFDQEELQYSVVRQRVRTHMNLTTPRYSQCTGGATSIEISPNGGYTRCPKFAFKQIYMGNLREEGPLRTLDIEHDDMSCAHRCNELMCFTKNVVRATSREELEAKVAVQGVRANYRPIDKGHQADVFVRWKLTDVCNYTCSYCTDWRSVNKKGMELTDEEILAALGKIIRQFKTISLRFTGGEPSARRCYVELMRRIHSNLDRFTDIEVRTNLSYQSKHREVLSWDWQGKLHLHVGCHVRDKNFMPWRTVELLRDAPNADYMLKFVATPTLREHIAFFAKYFTDNGIPESRMRIIEEVHDTEVGSSEPVVPEATPLARKLLEEWARRDAAAAAAAAAEPALV